MDLDDTSSKVPPVRFLFHSLGYDESVRLHHPSAFFPRRSTSPSIPPSASWYGSAQMKPLAISFRSDVFAAGLVAARTIGCYGLTYAGRVILARPRKRRLRVDCCARGKTGCTMALSLASSSLYYVARRRTDRTRLSAIPRNSLPARHIRASLAAAQLSASTSLDRLVSAKRCGVRMTEMPAAGWCYALRAPFLPADLVQGSAYADRLSSVETSAGNVEAETLAVPSAFYVDIAALTARNHFLSTRLPLPPTLAFGAAHHFLPQSEVVANRQTCSSSLSWRLLNPPHFGHAPENDLSLRGA
ncbi:hypothetical protein C8J57DRAFT_1518028 [Mycena rebaudengoi]|nr:hypothetical protein C8J57DRAFT_1518028 [Mycena rebaudengoi]